MRERPIILSLCPNAGKATTMAELVISAGQTFGVIIETTRRRIRPLRDDDLADLVRLIDNWAVALGGSHLCRIPTTKRTGRTWIALVRQDHATGRSLRFAVALKETDRLIGGVGLDGSTGDESEEPALGYWLAQPFGTTGMGVIIDYGYRTLGMETIRARTDPSNGPSQRVLQLRGPKNAGEIELTKPTRLGARRAPLFRITRENLA